MNLPLISHPTRDEETRTYTDSQLTDIGDLRLDAHNQVVSERAVRLFNGREETERYLRAAAALHDFGKATPQFQAHVRPNEDSGAPDGETAHARLGALATWYVLDQIDASDRDRLACTLAVARHHQALPNTAQYTAEPLSRAFEQGDSAIRAQLDAINKKWPSAAEELLAQAGSPEPDWEEFYSWAISGNIVSELRSLSAEQILGGRTEPNSARLPEKLYDRTLRYWSAITLADKSHAMDIPEDWIFDLDTLDRQTIEQYIAEIRADPPENELEARLNDERERARRQAIGGIHEWLSTDGMETKISTLTLPTGLGKTFTGLSAAFEARDLLSVTEGDDVRPIIYALPYTSIIEQTRAIFEDPDLWGADPQRSALTVHHYLSQTVVHHGQYDAADSSDTDNEDTAETLGEAWRDGTILTTFVQLFESLAGPSNRQGLKLSALRGSLIILDEPQALPKDWWDGVERLLDLLTEEYQARVIAMTATQPSLVRNLDTVSLLQAGANHQQKECRYCGSGPSYNKSLSPAPRGTYFETAERVRYTIDATALSKQLGRDESHIGYETAADQILQLTENSDSTLAICNTISSSRELTETLTARAGVVHLGDYIEDELTTQNLNATDPDISIDKIVDPVLDRVRPRESGLNGPDRTFLLTLNSRYRPFDREIIIELADRLSTSGVPFIVVSTQAIEAGVDLSFRTVFRDIAPLDSIVQAAGRCNRSYEWGENGGRVIVWMLAAPSEKNPHDPSESAPAHYVYERGSTDAGIPGHLELISSVLAELPNPDDVQDVTLSRDAVTAYFNALERKSLWNSELRDAIDNAKGEWLSCQSLIGGQETVDVVVAVTGADKNELDVLSEQLQFHDPEGYDRLKNAAGIRVSLPKSVLDDAVQVVRLDRQERGSDGVQVFEYRGGSGLEYNLAKGGLTSSKNSVTDRFTL